MSPELLAAGFLVVFVILIAGFTVYERTRKGGRNLREIPAVARLIHAIGLAVEDGTRLHVALGASDMTGEGAAPALAGLAILDRVARTASISDAPPVVTSGDGALSVLSQGVLAGAYRETGAGKLHDPSLARLVGTTPFSFAAGAMPVIHDEQVSATLMTGHFGPELALITEAADRTNGFTLAGTDSLAGQAVLYAAAQEPLIGEELFAAGAYLRAGLVHTASLRAQDVFRWLIIAGILAGGAVKLFG
ncbi:MAG TPA: DUF6754 domain-containing protein [Anaerolineales bacterium]|nr:DUF6754 domain-containing protein [Anaerolineales bacterium]